jgi:hypothetical protein
MTFNLRGIRLDNEIWTGYRHEFLQTQYAVANSFPDGGVNTFGIPFSFRPRFCPAVDRPLQFWSGSRPA